jgi:hypothetical protein
VILTMITKDPVVQAIVIEEVPTMIIKIQVVLQTDPAVEATADGEIQIGVHPEILAEALLEILVGVPMEIRTGVLPETWDGVLQEIVVHNLVHVPIHLTEDKILPPPVAHVANNQVQVMVGKLQDVKKVLQEVHRAKTTIATRQRIGHDPILCYFYIIKMIYNESNTKDIEIQRKETD